VVYLGLFSKSQLEQINQIAAKSKELNTPTKSTTRKNITADLNEMSQAVLDYFQDSLAILIESRDQLHEYIDEAIESGYAGIDTETTGLDRIHDTIVGASLYYPGGVECYIPMKHLVPIFDEPYKNQLSYEDVTIEFQRLADSNIKLIFANADFDLAMIYKDLKVDFNDRCYYDVILAWRCLKENELDNTLKGLYNKYVLKGAGDPKKFSDFFTPQMFPYCKPEVAKLYAANDAKITYDLFKWQLPYVTKDHPKCKKAHLEKIADLVWNVEFPLISVCQNMHRLGMYVDKTTTPVLLERYTKKRAAEMDILSAMVDDELAKSTTIPAFSKKPFTSGSTFNPKSPPHVKYLLYTVMNLPQGKNGGSTDKTVLAEMNLPITNQILKVRSLGVLISTFVEKMPNATTADSRIHARFSSVGAACITGDSLIPTDSGYYTIEELTNKSNVIDLPDGEFAEVHGIQIINKDQSLESASHCVCYHNVSTIKVTTELGLVLEGTPNHPIMVSKYTASERSSYLMYNYKGEYPRLHSLWEDRRFKQLDELKINDLIEIPCNFKVTGSYQQTNLVLTAVRNHTSVEAQLPDIFNEEFAEFLGMYHADGSAACREGTYTIALSNDDPDVYTRYSELAKSLFNVTTCQCAKQRENHEVETYIDCMQLRDLDHILCHGTRNKKIPDAIYKSPSSVINAYIKGMTLDSTVYVDENERVAFELSILNEQDARFVQQYLISQGIYSHISYNVKGVTDMFLCLVFNADNYLLFRDHIGFIETKKIKDTKPCVKNQYWHRRVGDSFYVKVKKIEHSVNDVYDFVVPETHSFISNGMISHNTGRLSSSEPNVMNIPSNAHDIRHMFRATPGYVMLSSDYSRQEPAITAFVSGDKGMLDSFIQNRDIYASIASLAFNVPYEKCLEFHPDTHEYQPDGKARRGEAKTILLGISYGRAIPSIAEQLYNSRDDMTDEEKIKGAQKVYDSVMNAFPGLRKIMLASQKFVVTHGYTETILGRRRHLPDMQLPEYEFKPLAGYVNPDIDPLDPETLKNKSDIPERIKASLLKEFKGYKYFGQVANRMKQLHDGEHIKVINNRSKIQDATRQILNSIIQGSAADMSKLAILNLCNDPDWLRIGGRLLTPIHDELCCEVPIEHWKEGGEILSRCMIEAASFLPFNMTCDVTTTLRWYGLEYPCKYPKPESLENLSPEEIKWVQYQLYENEYILPVYKDENGEKPRGDAALGVNGIESDEYFAAIEDYKRRYHIESDIQFIEHIEHKVIYGESL